MFGFGSPPMGGFHHPGFGPPSPYRSAPAMSPQHTSPHQALSEVSTNVPSPFGGVHTAPSGGPSARGNGFFSPMGPFSSAPASATTINSTTGAAASKEVAASSVSSPTPAPSPKAASPKIRTVSQAPLPSQQVQQRYRAGSAPSFAGVVGPRFGGSGAMLRSSRSDELLDGPSGGNFWDDAAGPTASAAGTGGASSMGGVAPFSPPAATSTASPDRPAAAASPSPPSDGAETTATADIEAATALFESLAIAGGNNDGDGVTGRLASGDVKAADQAECSCTSGSSKNMCRSCTAKRDQLLSFANGCPTLTRLYALGEVLYAHETNVVFRAHRKSLPGATGECVVKIFSSSSTRAGEAPHEARMLSGLRSHDNVVDLLTWHALGDGKFAVVIPWVDAESFSVRSSTPAERRDYMAQLLAGLAHLHGARVMHLDIKPGNVLRERKSGRVVIIDFDSAERVDPYDPVYELLGTDGYIAPEVLNPNVAATAKADVWSAGAMMYELVYETYIEDDDAPADLYARARGDAHRSAAHDLLARLLEPSPDRRLSAADALSHPYFA